MNLYVSLHFVVVFEDGLTREVLWPRGVRKALFHFIDQTERKYHKFRLLYWEVRWIRTYCARTA